MVCRSILVLFLLASLSVVGCNNAENQLVEDSHSHAPKTNAQIPFEVLIVEISGKCDAIKVAFEEDRKDEAHDPLHEIGYLIAKLPDAARKENLGPSELDQVKAASDQLMIAFGKVDALFHGDESGVEYNQVEPDVQNALAVLMEKANPKKE